jgi:hypothetical protein
MLIGGMQVDDISGATHGHGVREHGIRIMRRI